MPYIYQRLIGREIRLLTLAPADDDPASPVSCTLEHVPLPAVCGPSSDHRFKGDGYVWPETQAPYDTPTIFKKGAASKTYHDTPGPPAPSAWTSRNDEDMPWRHTWGDYIALSYVWGTPEPARTILLDGHQFSISPNLFHALIQLRQTQRVRQGFKLWVDAICIDQGDVKERSQQVARARDVYASAWQVVMWLGPEADGSGLALTALSWIASFSRANPSLDTFYQATRKIDARPLFIIWERYKTPLRKEVYKALFRLLTRPYWQRMWILQEVAMARSDVPVLCGRHSITWGDIHDSAQYIARDESRFGCDIIHSSRPRAVQGFSFEFGTSRVIHKRQWASERMWGLLVDMMKVQRSQKQPGKQKSAVDTLRPLLLGREAAVLDEKDRVYAVLGIKEIADRVTIVPDYKLPARDIYLDFTAKLLATGDLNILRLVARSLGLIYTDWRPSEMPPTLQHSRITTMMTPLVRSFKSTQKTTLIGTECANDLPSWAICWTCKPAPMAQLCGTYNAGGPAASFNVFNTADTSFAVRGYIVDTIGSLSSFHVNEVDALYPTNAFQAHRNQYGDLDSARAALWRTIVADTTATGGTVAPESYSWLLDPKIWADGVAGVYNNQFGLHNLMARNKGLILCGYSLQELIYGPRTSLLEYKALRRGQLYNPTKQQCEALSWAVNVTAWRRLLGTENGRMGLGPAAARPGDAIAILPGCSTPIVLRSFSEGWIVIGECYIHGVMYGEVPKSYSGDERLIRLY